MHADTQTDSHTLTHTHKEFFVCRNMLVSLTIILLMWTIWWAPNNASKWQMGFISAFEGLKLIPPKPNTYLTYIRHNNNITRQECVSWYCNVVTWYCSVEKSTTRLQLSCHFMTSQVPALTLNETIISNRSMKYKSQLVERLYVRITSRNVKYQ